jgi:hypothetical protein
MEQTNDIRRWSLVPERERAATGVRRYRLRKVAPLTERATAEPRRARLVALVQR